LKALLVAALKPLLRVSHGVREQVRRLLAHASLASQIHAPVPTSVVVIGPGEAIGTGTISVGEDVLLYPGFYFEASEGATLSIGAGCVLSRGVHLTARGRVTIGAGTMIGEYSSVRDANHARTEGVAIKNSGYAVLPVTIGREVWLGRGVTVLPGVEIGDGATVGANAVVTKDIPAGEVWGGVPARRLSAPQE